MADASHFIKIWWKPLCRRNACETHPPSSYLMHSHWILREACPYRLLWEFSPQNGRLRPFCKRIITNLRIDLKWREVIGNCVWTSKMAGNSRRRPFCKCKKSHQKVLSGIQNCRLWPFCEKHLEIEILIWNSAICDHKWFGASKKTTILWPNKNKSCALFWNRKISARMWFSAIQIEVLYIDELSDCLKFD